MHSYDIFIVASVVAMAAMEAAGSLLRRRRGGPIDEANPPRRENVAVAATGLFVYLVALVFNFAA